MLLAEEAGSAVQRLFSRSSRRPNLLLLLLVVRGASLWPAGAAQTVMRRQRRKGVFTQQ